MPDIFLNSTAKQTERAAPGGQRYLEEVKQFERLPANEQYELARTIELGAEAKEQLEQMESELDDDAVDELYALVEAGEQARTKLLESYMQFVVSIARKMTPNGDANPCFMDAVQEGNLGLIHALSKYDFTTGTTFGTYAYSWVRNYIGTFLTNQRSISVPDKLVADYRQIRQAENELSTVLGRKPTYAEIANELNVEESRVKTCISQCELVAASIDDSITALSGEYSMDCDATIGDVVVGDYNVFGDSPEEHVVAAERAEALRNSMDECLKEQEKVILQLHYGFVDGTTHSLRSIARMLGVTPSRIGQVRKAAIQKLRDDKNLANLKA